MSVSPKTPQGATVDLDTLNDARKAVESAITQVTTIKLEPDASDCRNGERLAWLLDDLLRARLELGLLADGAETAPEAEDEPADALRQVIDMANDEILEGLAKALGQLEDARRSAPDAAIQPVLDQAVVQTHNVITSAFGKLGRGLRHRDALEPKPQPRGSASERSDRRGLKDARSFASQAEDALGEALEFLGSDWPDETTWEWLRQNTLKAWQNVRLCRRELEPANEGGSQ